MNIYNKNRNGEAYLILEQRGDTALLARIGDPKFVVAYGFEQDAYSWGSGAYFGTLKEALERYESNFK